MPKQYCTFQLQSTRNMVGTLIGAESLADGAKIGTNNEADTLPGTPTLQDNPILHANASSLPHQHFIFIIHVMNMIIKRFIPSYIQM